MSPAIRVELRKVAASRTWWILLGAMALYVAIGAYFCASLFTATRSHLRLTGADAASATYSVVNGLGYVFPLLIGTLAVTSEFRYQTISTSLAFEPKRPRFLGGKLAAIAPFGMAYGVVGTLAALATGPVVLSGQGSGPYLTDGSVILGLAMGLVTSVMWAMFGVAIGALIRNQVAAVVAVLVFTLLVEPMIRMAGTALPALGSVAAFLPGAATDAMVGASFLGSDGSAELLPRATGLLVMCGYVMALVALASRTTMRRDITA